MKVQQEVAEDRIVASAPEGATEEAVIHESQWDVVRGLAGDGVGKKEIARRLAMDIKTVRKWLKHAWKPQTRTARPSVVAVYEPFVRERAPEVGYNASVLFREIQGLGYEGSYPALLRFVRPLRPMRPAEEPAVRFETPAGKQSQVDWGQTQVWIGEEKVKIHLFTMILGFSRRLFARAYLDEKLGSLLDAHDRAFEHFGGRTESILYDNPRTIVVAKDEQAGTIEWNRTFKDRMDFYGVEVKLCRYYRAQTKGKVERGVAYVKKNAMAGKRFASLEELNAYLVEWCLTVADTRIHGSVFEQPCARFEREEKQALIPITRRPAPAVRRESRRVTREGHVMVETNRYPVDYGWVGREVVVEISAGAIVIALDGSTPIRYEPIAERHRVARWSGPPRSFTESAGVTDGPPRFDPAWLHQVGEVEIRSLAQYAAVAQEVEP